MAQLALSSSDHFHQRIAVIDDDPAVTMFLTMFLTKSGYAVDVFTDAESFLTRGPSRIEKTSTRSETAHIQALPSRNNYDLLLVDVNLPGMSGLLLLKKLKAMDAAPEVLLISGKTNVSEAVQGIKIGAFDYVEKPFDIQRLETLIRNVLRLAAARKKIKEMQAPIVMDGIPCVSSSMTQVYDVIRRASSTSSNVMISGESGVGKEIVAKAIHDNSPRSKKHFVSINCSAIPEHLLESELFGHCKGAFTGAHQDRMGLFLQASGGTLFLDEIGDLPPVMQVKLLRVVQERKVRPIGGNREFPIDVRLVSATNKNLSHGISEGTFREDLFYRLNVIPIFVPPLRQRKEDILVLATYFLESTCRKLQLNQKQYSTSALESILQMQFRGNVRELQNLVERAIIFSESDVIGESEISRVVETEGTYAQFTNDAPMLRELEMQYIKSILDKYPNDKLSAARVLGVSRRTLYRKLEELEKRKSFVLLREP